MKKFLFPLVLCIPFLINGQNQAVEIESSNSGLLLPRLVDTSNVSHPQEGLLIYDLADKKPAYYNGNTWNSLVTGSTLGQLGDSLTYTISAPNANARMDLPLVDGTYPLGSFNWGMTNDGQLGGSPNPTYLGFNLSMPIDANWIPFQDLLRQSMPATKEIEIKVFKSGSVTPEFSLKLKNGIDVISIQYTSLGEYSLTVRPHTVSLTYHATNTTIDIDLVQSP